MDIGTIIAGEYQGKGITKKGKLLVIVLKPLWTVKPNENCIVINKENVNSYALVDKTKDDKKCILTTEMK